MDDFKRILLNLPSELQDIILEKALATCYKIALLEYLNTADDSMIKYFNKSFNNILFQQNKLLFEENPNVFDMCRIKANFKPFVNFFKLMDSRRLNFNHLIIDSYNSRFSSLIFALIKGCNTFEVKNIDTFLILRDFNGLPEKLTKISWGGESDDGTSLLRQTIIEDKKFTNLQEIEIDTESSYGDIAIISDLISCLKKNDSSIKLRITTEYYDEDKVEEILRIMDDMSYNYKNVKLDVGIRIPGNLTCNTCCDIKTLTLRDMPEVYYENYKTLLQLLRGGHFSVETLFIDCEDMEIYGEFNWLNSTNLKTLKIRSPHLSVNWLNKNIPDSVNVLDLTILKYYDTPFIVPYNIDYLIINVESFIPNVFEFLDLSESSVRKIRIVDDYKYEYSKTEFNYNFHALPDMLQSIDICLNKVTDHENKSFVTIGSENISKSLYSRSVYFNCHASIVDGTGKRIA